MLDPLLVDVGGRLAWPWWAKLAGAVWSATVVVPDVVCEHCAQVPLTENQKAVGDFGSDGTHESFSETVCPWATRRSFHHMDARVREDCVERRCELPRPVPNEEPEFGGAVAEIDQEVAGRWVVHAPSGFVVAPSRCTYRVPTSRTKNT
jgi:hypothetical protein